VVALTQVLGSCGVGSRVFILRLPHRTAKIIDVLGLVIRIEVAASL